MNGAPSGFARRLAMVVALDAAILLPTLPRLTLWQIDEGRIAEVSREMALSGDFVTPRMGGLPFACYPPLPYWLMAASGSVFGWNEFAMRLPSAFAGLALVALVGLITRRLSGETAGLAAAMVLATLPGFFIQEKMCRADVLTLFFATFAFDRFLTWAESPDETRRARDLLLMYVSVSLGVLSKGPIAIAMLGLAGLAWFIIRKQWKLLPRMGWLWGLPLSIAIILPWYVLVYRAAGGAFLRENLLFENVEAFLNGYQQKQPPYFYLLHAPPVMLPWILALALARKFWRASGLSFTVVWLGAVFLFLSISGAKRQSYVTYLQPALAMSVGIILSALWSGAPILAKQGLWIMGLVLAGSAGVLVFARRRSWEAERIQLIQDLFPLFAGLLVAAALAVTLATWRKGPIAGTVVLAFATVGGLLASALVLESRWEYDGRDGKAFCRRVAQSVPEGTTIAVLKTAQMDGAYHFYVGRPLPALTGEPGYYIVNARQRDELVTAGRKVRQIDSVSARRSQTLFIQVIE